MKNWIKILLLLSVLFTGIVFIQAQTKTDTRKDLEKKKEKLQKEIDATNQLLKQNQKNKNLTKQQLEQLTRKIKARESLINTINTELNLLAGEINRTTTEIEELNNQLDTLKANYAYMIRFANRNRGNYSQLSFLFASDDFNQAVKRIKYLQQYSEHRQKQAAQIVAVSSQLGEKKIELESKRNEKALIKTTEEKQKENLAVEKKEREKLLTNLSKQETSLKKQLAEKKARKKKLDDAIAAAVKKEIEAARKKALADGKKNVTKDNAIALTLTPEAQKLSKTFAGNKGLLPWPVEKGTITEFFGSHPHPSLKNVTIKNDGIDIATTNGAGVRSIFQGEVTGIINIPGSGSAVIIRHGEYLSVYSNLESVSVSKSQKITTKQSIGKAGNDLETGKGMVNLQIWKGFDKMNPELWLLKR